MSFELAIIGSTIGIAFALLYASKLVSEESRWHLPLQIFFFSLGIYFLFITSTNAMHIITANNSTIADETSYNSMVSTSSLSITVMTYSLIILIVWIVGFLIFWSIYTMIQNAQKKRDIFKDKGGDDE